jgi:hypothetical protein
MRCLSSHSRLLAELMFCWLWPGGGGRKYKEQNKKVMLIPERARKAQRGVEIQLYSFFNLSGRLEVGIQCHATAALLLVPFVKEAVWAPGSVWTGAENLAPTGTRSSDLSARSELLY